MVPKYVLPVLANRSSVPAVSLYRETTLIFIYSLVCPIETKPIASLTPDHQVWVGAGVGGWLEVTRNVLLCALGAEG